MAVNAMEEPIGFEIRPGIRRLTVDMPAEMAQAIADEVGRRRRRMGRIDSHSDIVREAVAAFLYKLEPEER